MSPFIGEPMRLEGAAEGPLQGLTFAIKDLFDVAGYSTGCGNPTWLATHPPASRTAPVVEALLAAGATAVGKTITDELAYSLSGENAWYGTPLNPAAPGRIPGGSSSGSASAVASGLADFALGTDTGGSVRIPASFCGLYGLRPSHGALSLEGVMPLAPSFDTVGWFAPSAALMARVGDVLLGHLPAAREVRLLYAADREPSWRPAGAEPVTVGFCAEWADAFSVLQRHEVWQSHGAWIRTAHPQFGPGVAERFEAAARVTEEEVQRASVVREEMRSRLLALLEEAVLVLPTAPSAAPLPGSGNDFRRRCLQLLCPAGLAGLPQLSLPLSRTEDGPVGVSLLGSPGSERTLLALAGI